MIGTLTYARVLAAAGLNSDHVELFRTTVLGEADKEQINELVAVVQAETRRHHYLDKADPQPVAIVAVPPQPSVTQPIDILWLLDPEIIPAFRTAHQVTLGKTAIRLTSTPQMKAQAERTFEQALRSASRQSSHLRHVSVVINGGVDIFDDLLGAARMVFIDRLIRRLELASHHRRAR